MNPLFYMSPIAVIFHVGNIDIFHTIYAEYKDFFSQPHKIVYFITTHNQENKNTIQQVLPHSFIEIIPNKGMDIGGKLRSIQKILQYEQYETIDAFYFLHTKTNPEWRNRMMRPLLNHRHPIGECCKKNKQPLLIGCKEYTYPNHKSINRKYIVELFQRNVRTIPFEKCTKYFDDYIFDIDGEHDKDTFFFNPSFYKEYEADMKQLNEEELRYHYECHGKREFHRISNPCYIRKKGVDSFFIAGSVFVSNRAFLHLFKHMDLSFEFDLLEEGYVINDVSRKTHAWEYFFGLLCYIHNSSVFSISEKGEITVPRIETPAFRLQSVVSIDPHLSRIAFFLLTPSSGTLQSGGYRTLIQYIAVLEKHNIFVDIYFGNSTHDMNTDAFGMSTVTHPIHELISYLDPFHLLDMSKHNFFLGFKVQRKYDVLVANAWQVAESVWLNRGHTKHLAYIIQDEEALFYPDDSSMQKMVVNTYMPEYHYYCLSKYLYHVFQSNGFRSTCSTLGVNIDVYSNQQQPRTQSVVIAYYTYKVGRLPAWIESIIESISASYTCYVFPCDYCKTRHPNIVNLGAQTVEQLNALYNRCTVGIVMSNTNPSRLGYEMLASGLRVIEYDSKFTEQDMPSDYFYKIRNTDRILDQLDMQMKKEYKYPFEYIETISSRVEHTICLSFFTGLLYGNDNDKNPFVVIKAEYGAKDMFVDVTEKVRELFLQKKFVLDHGEFDIQDHRDFNGLFGDPYYGVVKELNIEMVVDGRTVHICKEEPGIKN